MTYLNGIGATGLHAACAPSGGPLIVHAHELADGARRALHPDARRVFTAVDLAIAVTDEVAEVLTDQFGVEPERVVVIPGALPRHPLTDDRPRPAAIDRSGPLIGSVGAGSRRKGIDLFVALAAEVVRRRPDARFLWVGPLDDPDTVAAEVRAVGLSEHLLLVGEVESSAGWLRELDVFVSTAREDPLPLAVLEAVVAGAPVLTFENGGTADLLRRHGYDDAVVPALDVAGMADRLVTWLDDPPEQRHAAIAVQREHTISVVGPKLLEAIERASR